MILTVILCGCIMPKIEYIDYRPHKRSMKIIEIANSIISEYAAEGMRLTLRQLYYQFVARDYIPNKQKEYDNLGAVISRARLGGLIDWNAIEDRTRNLAKNTHWRDPGHIIGAARAGFMVDRWAGQEYRVEVWIEKEALVGVIADICDDLDVAYFACRGYVSQSEMWAAAMRMQRYADNEQHTVILHLGDHDPSGIDMTRDIEDRQSLFGGCMDIRRIALNMDQVKKYSPPPNPAKLTDSRCASYIDAYGPESWELDALEPRVLKAIITRHVEDLRDDNIYREQIELEEKYTSVLEKVESDWQTLLDEEI